MAQLQLQVEETQGLRLLFLAYPEQKTGLLAAPNSVNKPRQHGVPRKCRFGNNEVLCSASGLLTYLRGRVAELSRK